MRQALEKSKPPKPNISKRERQALKSLQDDDSIIILPADKGNATVVMDRVEYSNKLAELIDNGANSKVKKDPTLKTERKLSQILGKNKDLLPKTKYRQLMQMYSTLPHIFGLRKFIRMVFHWDPFSATEVQHVTHLAASLWRSSTH